MLKFQRQYKLSISTVHSTGPADTANGITIDSTIAPLTCEFTLNRESLSSVQSGTIKIYNLNVSHRELIFKDSYDTETSNNRWIKLEAGYDGSMSQILNGLIQECSSYRESGGVNIITEIGVLDYSTVYTQSDSSWTLSPPEYTLPITQQTVVNRLVKDITTNIPGTQAGVTAPIDSSGAPVFSAIHSSPVVVSGSTWDALLHETNGDGHWYIENGIINYLGDNDALQVGGSTALVVEADTGLLSTPRKRGAYLTLEMLFEPTIRIGQLVKLQSLFPLYNNPNAINSGNVNAPYYKVVGYDHQATISGAVCGKCTTTLRLNSGILKFNQQTNHFEATTASLASLPGAI